MLEFAVGLPLLLLVLLVGIDLVRVGFNVVSLQFGTYKAARYAALMQSDPSSTREESIRARLVANSGLDVTAGEITYCERNLSGENCMSESAGGRGEWIELRVEHRVPLILINPEFRIHSTQAFRNEPT